MNGSIETSLSQGWPNLIYLNLTFSFTNSKVHSFCFLYHHDQSGPIVVLFFGKTGSLFRLLISSVSLPFQLHMASLQKCIPVISHTLWQQWRCEIGLFSAPGEGRRSSELSLLESLWMKHSVKTNWLSLCRQLYLPPKHFQVLKSHRKIKEHQIYLEICLLAISFLLLTLERSFESPLFFSSLHDHLSCPHCVPGPPILLIHRIVPGWSGVEGKDQTVLLRDKSQHTPCIMPCSSTACFILGSLAIP